MIGSYLNVCIYRVPRKTSVFHPARSFCPKCETQLKWNDNIPVLSWLLLGGKCRYCKDVISGRYPFVEVLSVIAGLLSYFKFGLTPTGILIYFFTITLLVITFIDLDFKIIPDIISLPGTTIGFIIGCIQEVNPIFSRPITSGGFDTLLGFLVGAGTFYVIGYIYYFMTKRWGLGGGDIKLLGFSGALLGWKSVIPTIFAGSLFGAFFGIAVLYLKGGGRHSEIPFGPWLALGILLYVFVDLPFFRMAM